MQYAVYVVAVSVRCWLVSCMPSMSVVYILSVVSCFVPSICCVCLSIVVHDLFRLSISDVNEYSAD